jgi:hypothetical protein
MKKFYRIGLILLFLLILGCIFIALYLFNLKDKDLQKVKPDAVISATELQKVFETNESKADSIYLNKIIEVSGTIRSVNPGEDKAVNISLETENPLSSIICTFKSLPDSSGIKPGDQITIRGELTGFLLDVLLNNCILVNAP